MLVSSKLRDLSTHVRRTFGDGIPETSLDFEEFEVFELFEYCVQLQ